MYTNHLSFRKYGLQAVATAAVAHKKQATTPCAVPQCLAFGFIMCGFNQYCRGLNNYQYYFGGFLIISISVLGPKTLF